MLNKNAPLSALALLTVLAVSAYADSPSPVTVINRDQIEDTGIANVGDLIGRVPGLTTPDSSGTGTATVNIRGLGPDGTLILVDGRRAAPQPNVMENPFAGEYLERVEILKGPAATSMYGAEAVAGVVNLVTRDSFPARNPYASFLYDDLDSALSKYFFTFESEEECDATHGSAVPHWTFTPDRDIGMPKFSLDGDFMTFGGTSKGYKPGSLYIPNTTPDFDEGWFFAPAFEYTYEKLESVIQRIQDDPDAHPQDKRDYIGGLMFAGGLVGPGSLSDQAIGVFRFDPEEAYRDFKTFSSTRTDEERAAAARVFGDVPMPSLPKAPATKTPIPGEPTVEKTGESAAPKYPNPFDRYPYPPEYAFDFGACSDEQAKKIRELIRERDQGRADHSYYMDYLRRPGQTSEDVKADEQAAQEALNTRDSKNAELKRLWEQCVNPAAGDATKPAPTNPQFSTGSMKWNLEAYIKYDSSMNDEPEPDIGFDITPYNYGTYFDLPLSPDAFRDVDLDSGMGSNRAYPDDNGVIRVPGAIETDRLQSRFRLQFDSTAESDAGITFGARVRVQPTDDWQYFVDFDSKRERWGPTIGLRYKREPVDSYYQEYVPGFDSGLSPDGLTGGARESYDFFHDYLGTEFEFGGRTIRRFTAAENRKLDWSALEYLKGQTYFAEDKCGDSALPPEGSGYLTADRSPVKEPGDQWAFEHVGLLGDEPSMDEFAKPVVVAVIDTGLDWNHADFSWDNLWHNEDEVPGNLVDDDGNGYVDDIIGWDFTGLTNRPWDNDGHGTAVAGIIAATQGNDTGIDGINSSAKIMVLKALNNFGRTRATYIAEAIVYAANNGAQLINLSVTGPFPKVVQDAVDYAMSKGALVINAAGNRAQNIDESELAPLHSVVTVAATDPDDKRAVFSNVGSSISVAAPGVDIVSLRARRTDFMYNSGDTSYVKEDAFLGEDRRYYRSTGTSFATPIVTGIASLLLSRDPGMRPADIVRVLRQSARDVEAPGVDLYTGYGVVDAKAALAADPAFFIYAEIGGLQPVDIDGQGNLEVLGVAAAEQFKQARVEIGQGKSPDSWTIVGGALAQEVIGDSLARIPVESLADGETWTIRLTVEHANGRTREARYLVEL